ncbi:MAG: protein kinase [Gemmatimonadetes bacterium]|jgi:tetratricopeptide (TPR) repeat protein|nr:protein kinase [Gemmatimonadota bacterium]MBP6668135.1 protein kinase [Gemmatimonadales bacterium]MBK6781866.1 protein kinase [Gemmatimonadota bacterium]MBK7717232.1 protein kinase [Gemmatimonadota bacterium]MBK7925862.1 protein kinase [Gemmatimonadota bacterium]
MDPLAQRLAAALGDRYRIEGQAGQGGMATVYRARDLKHDRAVAIKVLRAELSAAIGGPRFLQEIEVSARLQHPHIVPLYDSGEADGILYYVMPFVEGESLRDRLTRERRLPFAEAVTLARETASALAYAHQRGIVHRDIKPENIMLSGGHAVVADFGIARALSAAQQGGGGNLTGIGFAIGTPAYMSPEQATASEVDGRSDQYALACVFYEMVTGAMPFAGQTVQAVLAKSLTGPRPKLSKVNREAPADADAPVARALDADPAKRFDSVTSFAAALEQAAGGGAGGMAERRRLRRLVVGLPLAVAAVAAVAWFFVPRGGVVVEGAERIAVLPFHASGAGVELMGEGMVDLLTTNLNAVGGIQAAEPRAVLAAWRKRGTDASDLEGALAVGRSVKAQAVILGSIVATGAQVRLSADLYGSGGKSLARAQVDGSSDSVLALVDSLSLRLVREIWRSNEPVPSVRVSGLTTGSLAAMREYLAGEQHYRRSAWDSAAAAFRRAIEQDSTFALAHYRLAATLGWSGGIGVAAGLEASDAARRFGNRLPPREHSLVIAYNLFSHQRLEAIDSARAYVAKYPDDVDGWFLLGETQFHSRQLVGYSPDQLRAPFDSVLARDSSLTPASIHLVETALSTRDRPRYETYLRVLQSSDNAVENQAYAGAGRLVFGDGLVDSATARAMLRYAASIGAAQLSIQQGDPSSDSLLARFESIRQFVSVSGLGMVQYYTGRGLLRASLGQLAAARADFDTVRTTNQDQAYGILLFPLLQGFAPADYAPEVRQRMLAAPRQNPFQVYYQAAVALNLGERTEGTRLLDSLLAHRDPKMPPKIYDVLRATRGWAAMMAGDTVGGLATMRSALEDVGAGWNSFMTAPLRLQMAAAMALRPETRDAGRRLLRHGFVTDLGLAPLATYALGRAEEAAGNRPAAAEAYAQFLAMWDKADPALAPRVAEVKDALSRVTGEPK